MLAADGEPVVWNAPMSVPSGLLIGPDVPAAHALRQMDASGEKILIVVDDGQVILGVVTDGDVRRWIISGRGLDEPVAALMNPHPVVLTEPYEPDEARALLLKFRIECIPVLDGTRRVVEVVRWLSLMGAERRIHSVIKRPVVIMAGGEGTRLAPFTKVLPKPLFPIGDKSIMERIIERFSEYGCDEFYLTLNYKANLVKAYFSDVDRDYSLEYVEEPCPLGTAGGLSLLRGRIDSTFFLSNCDVLVDVDLVDFHRFHSENGNRISLVGSTKQFAIPYGVCRTGSDGILTRMDEKPGYHLLVSTGLYLVEPDVICDVPERVLYNVTDLINLYLERGERIGVYPVSEGSWMDMGQWDELQSMLERFDAR